MGGEGLEAFPHKEETPDSLDQIRRTTTTMKNEDENIETFCMDQEGESLSLSLLRILILLMSLFLYDEATC